MAYLNNIYADINFTVKVEQQGCLPFLNLLLILRPDGTLSHVVYWKPTHTGIYLNSISHHHPAQKRGVMLTLINRAHQVVVTEHLHDELLHLRRTF